MAIFIADVSFACLSDEWLPRMGYTDVKVIPGIGEGWKCVNGVNGFDLRRAIDETSDM